MVSQQSGSYGHVSGADSHFIWPMDDANALRAENSRPAFSSGSALISGDRPEFGGPHHNITPLPRSPIRQTGTDLKGCPVKVASSVSSGDSVRARRQLRFPRASGTLTVGRARILRSVDRTFKLKPKAMARCGFCLSLPSPSARVKRVSSAAHCRERPSCLNNCAAV